MYDFGNQLREGHKGEKVIRQYLSKEWIVKPVTMADQKRGIDFSLINKKNPSIKFAIEIKTDHRAFRTGNAFVETWSAYPTKKGWAYTCQADYLFYFLPEGLLVYVFAVEKLKVMVEHWRFYSERKIKNKTWETRGVLVPLHEFEQHATQIIVF